MNRLHMPHTLTILRHTNQAVTVFLTAIIQKTGTAHEKERERERQTWGLFGFLFALELRNHVRERKKERSKHVFKLDDNNESWSERDKKY